MAGKTVNHGQNETQNNNHQKHRQQQYVYNKSRYNSKRDNLMRLIKLSPVLFIIALIPLISREKVYQPELLQNSWFPKAEWVADFFLYYKQWFFVTGAFIMLLIIIIKAYMDKDSIKVTPTFIPLAVYALFTVLSTLFSENISFSLAGSVEQFESGLALIGYCILVYYIYLFVRDEKDIKLILLILAIGVTVLSVIGVGQFLGKDIFATDFGKKLMLPKEEWNTLDDFIMSFEKGRVYTTLYNPNYTGVYAALVAPVLLTLLLFSKKLLYSVLYLIGLVGITICLVGSYSMTGILGFGAGIAGIMIFLWRYLLKRFYIFIPVILIICATLFVVNAKTNNLMVNRAKSLLKIEKTVRNLNGITTAKDHVSIDYKGSILNVALNLDNNYISFDFTDGNGNPVEKTYNYDTGIFTVQDERFKDFLVEPVLRDTILSFNVKIDGKDWVFTNQTGDGEYYYFNSFGRLDKSFKAPSAVFTGYEDLASRRGYLWSRSIPLLKDHILIGSGPDTFVLKFPQQDYANVFNYGMEGVMVTKPHNMYLQIGVQTGLISLIAFVTFYLMYFISSIRLYIRGRFNNFYAQVGLGIMMGTLAYMVSGFSNDSCITIAPIFWALMGLGIVVNQKAKPLILEEMATLKLAQQENTADVQ
ncbi:MAG: hypothetical protein K0S76_1375 [Herbinix sp.]|nr:hypothetical protein [Herbinix sp.]